MHTLSPFTCVIVDDEPLASAALTKQLLSIESLMVAGSFNNSIEASKFLEANSVDLLFLDVNMPQLNGIGLLQSLSSKPLVIFTTAHPSHALEAFGFDAVDYLLKPFSFQKLVKAVNKATLLLKAKTLENATSYTFVRSDGKYHKLYFDEVYYIEGMKDYVKVYSGAEILSVAMNLSNISDKFPKEIFLRVHKSYIVNKKKISKLNNYELMLEGATIPIGAAYRDNLQSEILLDHVTMK